MDFVLMSDGPTPLVWKERLAGFTHHVRCVRVAQQGDVVSGGPWAGCVVVQEQRSTNLALLAHINVPTLLITPWVTVAQAQVRRMRWVRVICPPRHAAEPGRLSDLLATVADLRAGAVVLGNEPMGQPLRRRQMPNGRRYVYGA